MPFPFPKRFINPDIIDVSNVVSSQDLTVGHHITKNNDTLKTSFDIAELTDIFVPSISFFVEYTSLILFSILIIFAFHQIAKKQRKVKINFRHINIVDLDRKLNKTLPFSLKFLLVFNVLFIFLVKNFITNNIKTSKVSNFWTIKYKRKNFNFQILSNQVIVDKEILLYDISKILSTKKKVCFFDDAKDVDIYRNALNGSLFHHFWYNMSNPSNPCFLRDFSTYDQFENFFLIGASYQMIVLPMLSYFRKEDVFINTKPMITENVVMYVSKKANQNIRNELNKWVSKQIENGFFLRLISIMNRLLTKEFPTNNIVYYSVKAYLDDNNRFDEILDFKKFCIFFYLHVLILTLLLFSRFFHILIVKQCRSVF